VNARRCPSGITSIVTAMMRVLFPTPVRPAMRTLTCPRSRKASIKALLANAPMSILSCKSGSAKSAGIRIPDTILYRTHIRVKRSRHFRQSELATGINRRIVPGADRPRHVSILLTHPPTAIAVSIDIRPPTCQDPCLDDSIQRRFGCFRPFACDYRSRGITRVWFTGPSLFRRGIFLQPPRLGRVRHNRFPRLSHFANGAEIDWRIREFQMRRRLGLAGGA
jgi:hypothetical protein